MTATPTGRAHAQQCCLACRQLHPFHLAPQADARLVEEAVDLGCATGLSSEHIRRAFPGAQVTGVDLSPHMVAVGRHLHQQRQVRKPQASVQNLLPLPSA